MTNQLTITCPDLGEISATKCAVRRNGNADCTGCSAWNRFAKDALERVEKDPFAKAEFRKVHASRTEDLPTIRCDGSRLIISVLAHKSMGAPTHVEVHMTPDGATLALKPLQEARAGSFRVYSGNKTRVVRCKTLANQLGKFPFTEAVFSPVHGMWCARLPR